jgi:hypothetical protein
LRRGGIIGMTSVWYGDPTDKESTKYNTAEPRRIQFRVGLDASRAKPNTVRAGGRKSRGGARAERQYSRPGGE